MTCISLHRLSYASTRVIILPYVCFYSCLFKIITPLCVLPRVKLPHKTYIRPIYVWFCTWRVMMWQNEKVQGIYEWISPDDARGRQHTEYRKGGYCLWILQHCSGESTSGLRDGDSSRRQRRRVNMFAKVHNVRTLDRCRSNLSSKSTLLVLESGESSHWKTS